VADRRVALSVVELGLACCGLEVREARRAADLFADADDGADGGGAADVGVTHVYAADGTVDVGGAADVNGAADTSGAADVNVLVVAGTVTSRLAPELAAAYAQLPQPRAVLAFGACAATGGPYWDSYSVLPGAHTVIPVDVWVPGCPPRPADLIAGLQEVVRGRR
jgi:NADH:ubiquinone oxidoreductase subunit B-like Fe-S oxidoreductase